MRRPLAAGLALLAVAAGLPQCGPAPLPRLVLPKEPRVLVFSPHPDDESIALGGLLFRLARASVPVRVVFLTSGDGYDDAARAHFRREPRPEEYRALGRIREREAVRAAERLGLPATALRFLGFPDGGLTELWGASWARPYTSPYTGRRWPPHGALDMEYEGDALRAQLERELLEFRPTVVFMPHPADTHADHAATADFVTEAVYALAEQHQLPDGTVLLTYLVHYPSWPLRMPPRWDRIVREPGIADTRWGDVELSRAERRAKRAAVGEYRTQLAVMRGFLLSFVGGNELVAEVDPAVLARIAAVH